MASLDTTLYRTYDEDLRRKRYDTLMTAARAVAAAFSDVEGADILVTGSLSRGQCHPWSDLDLLLRTTIDDHIQVLDMRSRMIDVAEENGVFQVDAIVESKIIPELQAGLVGSARGIDEVPPLGPLPDPDLAIVRSAISLELELERARRASTQALPALVDDEDGPDFESWTARMHRDRLEYRVRLALKRLAVFQDGGRSGFLDDGHDTNAEDLQSLLERLSAPAMIPYERPGVVPSHATDALIRLLTVDEYDVEDIRGELSEIVTVVEEWVSTLRRVTDLRETHGLDRTPPVPLR